MLSICTVRSLGLNTVSIHLYISQVQQNFRLKSGFCAYLWHGRVNDLSWLITQHYNRAKPVTASFPTYSQPTLSCLKETQKDRAIIRKKDIVSCARHGPNCHLMPPSKTRGSGENLWYLLWHFSFWTFPDVNTTVIITTFLQTIAFIKGMTMDFICSLQRQFSSSKCYYPHCRSENWVTKKKKVK